MLKGLLTKFQVILSLQWHIRSTTVPFNLLSDFGNLKCSGTLYSAM